jgi:hypothetical protein
MNVSLLIYAVIYRILLLQKAGLWVTVFQLPVLPAAVAAVLDRFPVFLPFFSPAKWTATDFAGFGG